MLTNSLFSILTLPQSYEAGTFRFNVVFLPRNLSPLQDLSVWGFPAVNPFADQGSNLNLTFKYIPDLSFLPDDAQSTTVSLPNIEVPNTARPIFEHFGNVFSINDIPNASQIPSAPAPHRFIKKYLPFSYRRAFPFTNPRVKEAVIDGSYHCAFKEEGINPNFKQTSNVISWGKVYAYCLRNPEIAKRAGLIFADLSLSLPAGTFENGGWIYADFDSSGYFASEAQSNSDLVRRYAARIPDLESGESRTLFAPILFPVTYGTPLPGIHDDQQREASDYDDGFAKILHGFQPINTNFLIEEATDEMLPPTKDIGIRLAWDDEQVLIWQNRQMTADPQAQDIFPMGVVNYKIDVREVPAPGGPENPWTSLNNVQPSTTLSVGTVDIMTPSDQVELGTEVYPMQIDGNQGRNYWLPAYFTQWNGKSLVLPDKEAAEIYRTAEEIRTYADGDNITKTLAAPINNQYLPTRLDQVQLIYGHQYEFRVRMGDISGGGPSVDDDRQNEAISQDDVVPFKRYVAPNEIRMRNLPDDNDGDTPLMFTGNTMVLRRPLLEYPNVVFTNKYENPVDKIKAYGDWLIAKMRDYNNWKAEKKAQGIADSYEHGLPDPDVNEVEIIVEVRALQMDNRLSVNKRDSYIHLYTVNRSLNALNLTATIDDNAVNDPFANIETPTEIAFEFRDANILNFEDPADLGDLNSNQTELNSITGLILPTARDIRITVRSLGADDDVYFGNKAWRKGKNIQFLVRQASDKEQNLLDTTFESDWIEGVYLQPDVEQKDHSRTRDEILLGKKGIIKPATMIQRLAQTLDLTNKQLSLIGEDGVRAQFGCAREIRHSLSPDGTSVTFSTKTDLLNHWLVTLNFRLIRDWTWDAMQLEGFVINRKKKFSSDANWTSAEEVGTIDLHRGINLQSLQSPDRSFTQLVFIDAVEPKPQPGIHPDTIELEYTIEPKFKSDEIPSQQDGSLSLNHMLPVTTIPAQVPVLASAGVALSKYKRDEKYANTEPREKCLWIELEEPIDDPNDELFIRFLSYAPDPLLVDIRRLNQLLEAPDEPVLPIDLELIRLIRPDQSDDLAGLNAMVQLSPAQVQAGVKPRHFQIPLPPGLHANSDELFGFFTYELRVGHRHIWSTAQGRFGRPLRVTGVQHPAPTLFCTTFRTEQQIIVNAPYAKAVHEGKNVTAQPPNTEIWCLLYAQVKMADNQDYRNILLGERKLEIRRQKIDVDLVGAFNQNLTLSNKDAAIYGTTTFKQDEVLFALRRLGLPCNSPLSVLCVEFLPTNPMANIPAKKSHSIFGSGIGNQGIPFNALPADQVPGTTAVSTVARPLSTHLGHFRILRTSPLTEVADIC